MMMNSSAVKALILLLDRLLVTTIIVTKNMRFSSRNITGRYFERTIEKTTTAWTRLPDAAETRVLYKMFSHYLVLTLSSKRTWNNLNEEAWLYFDSVGECFRSSFQFCEGK